MEGTLNVRTHVCIEHIYEYAQDTLPINRRLVMFFFGFNFLFSFFRISNYKLTDLYLSLETNYE